MTQTTEFKRYTLQELIDKRNGFKQFAGVPVAGIIIVDCYGKRRTYSEGAALVKYGRAVFDWYFPNSDGTMTAHLLF